MANKAPHIATSIETLTHSSEGVIQDRAGDLGDVVRDWVEATT